MDNKDLLEKAKKCKNKEELFKLAKDQNINISNKEIDEIFDQLNTSQELSEDSLASVSGGKGGVVDVEGSTFTKITEAEAEKVFKRGGHIIKLDNIGNYQISPKEGKSYTKYFGEEGFYKVTK